MFGVVYEGARVRLCRNNIFPQKYINLRSDGVGMSSYLKEFVP